MLLPLTSIHTLLPLTSIHALALTRPAMRITTRLPMLPSTRARLVLALLEQQGMTSQRR